MALASLSKLLAHAHTIHRQLKPLRRRIRRLRAALRKIMMLGHAPGGGIDSQTQLQRSANHRIGHVSATKGHHLFVWGGYECTDTMDENFLYPANIWVLNTVSGRWSRVECNGESPKGLSGATAQILDHKMYVVCGFGKAHDAHAGESLPQREVRVLDLRTWTWEPPRPAGGVKPFYCDKLSSWTWGGKIYIFGGYGFKNSFTESGHVEDMTAEKHATVFIEDASQIGIPIKRGWNNQCVAFNPETHSWEWPSFSSRSVPGPRAAHTTFVCGDDAFLFGGRCGTNRLNDLHVLHMPSMRWTLLQPEMPLVMQRQFPQGRSWHTFTSLGGGRALLYGGYSAHGEPLLDCWLLSVTRSPRGGLIPSWREWRPAGMEHRLWHCAEYVAETGRVHLVGGVNTNILNNEGRQVHPDVTLEIQVEPPSLMSLMVSYFGKCEQMAVPSFVPRDVRSLIELKREANLSALDARQRSSSPPFEHELPEGMAWS